MSMKGLRRKQFILPQDKLDKVRRALDARTETEAVILSLETVLRQKKLQNFARFGGQIRLSLSQPELQRMRRDSGR